MTTRSTKNLLKVNSIVDKYKFC